MKVLELVVLVARDVHCFPFARLALNSIGFDAFARASTLDT